MSTESPHEVERSADDEPLSHYRQSDLDAYAVSQAEVLLVRIGLGSVCLGSVLIAALLYGASAETTLVATAAGAMILLINADEILPA